MFKILFQSKFKFSSEIISPLTEASNQGSSTVGNLMINYPNAKHHQDEKNAKWLKILTKYSRTLRYGSYRETEVIEDLQWFLKKTDNSSTSVITKTFEFPEEYLALEFISLLKEKCDETNNRPSWTLTTDTHKGKFTICIELTSQFAKCITDRDYDIAAYLTYEYDHMLSRYMKRIYFKLLNLTFSTLVSYLIFSRLFKNDQDWWDFKRLSRLRIS